MHLRLAALLMSLLLILCACAPQVTLPASSLPQAQAPYTAPLGDTGLSGTETFALYLPSLDGQRLLCQYAPITFNRGRHPAEAVVRALLAHPGNDTVTPLSAQGSLQLAGDVETAGNVCTVPLTASALRLNHSQLYTVCLSLAATLCELPGIRAVNVLVNGQAPALDVRGCLPVGTLIPPADVELPVLWEQAAARRTPVNGNPSTMPLNSAATLYFPLADGSGIVPEIRSLSFAGQHPSQLTLGVLEALSSGAQQASDTASMPHIASMLIRAPEVTELDNGGRELTLYFAPALESTLRAQGVDPACLIASLVWSLTTFVPEVSSVQLFSGNSPITSLYHPSFGNLLFPNGVMRRSDFTAFLKEQAVLDFARDGVLVRCTRAMSAPSAYHPRALLLLLLDGPTEAEAAAQLAPTLPSGLTDADILGLSVVDDTLLVSLSERFARIIADSGMDQRLMCRSMVSTLCRCMNVRRIRFFFGGMPRGDLNSSIDWSGEFLYVPETTTPLGGF